jgi:hypothetical protein
MSSTDALSPNLRTDVAHPARIYDYILGGKDNFKADRDAAEHIVEASPSIGRSMRANRNYMARVAHHIAAELGLRQFLDIGTGLPTSPNLHEVVQEVAPECRVVYVDNDPIVLVHARALLTSTEQGRTAYVDADMRDPERIISSPEVTETLDLGRPVAVSLIAVLQYIAEEAEARRIIDTLMAPLMPGSVLALSTVYADQSGAAAYNQQGIFVKSRTSDEVEALFAGMDLVEPGVVKVHRWHPDAEAAALADEHVHMLGGVATKRG